jgi:hypothetical protein
MLVRWESIRQYWTIGVIGATKRSLLSTTRVLFRLKGQGPMSHPEFDTVGKVQTSLRQQTLSLCVARSGAARARHTQRKYNRHIQNKQKRH